MNDLHYKAIKKGARVWDRYARFCRHLNEAWRANLRGSYLQGANLRGADLRGAGAVAYMTPYHVLVWPGGARVGCQCKDRAGWVAMTPEEAEEIACGGADWWRQFGPVVLAMIAAMDNQ